MKEKLENINYGVETIERIANSNIADRDRLVFQDLCRNVMLGSNSNVNEIKKENEEWSLSKRLNEKYNLKSDKFNKMLIGFGGKVAKKYKDLHNNESPPKRDQYVGGTVRSINCYFSKDFDEFIDEMIEEKSKDFIKVEEEEEEDKVDR